MACSGDAPCAKIALGIHHDLLRSVQQTGVAHTDPRPTTAAPLGCVRSWSGRAATLVGRKPHSCAKSPGRRCPDLGFVLLFENGVRLVITGTWRVLRSFLADVTI